MDAPFPPTLKAAENQQGTVGSLESTLDWKSWLLEDLRGLLENHRDEIIKGVSSQHQLTGIGSESIASRRGFTSENTRLNAGGSPGGSPGGNGEAIEKEDRESSVKPAGESTNPATQYASHTSNMRHDVSGMYCFAEKGSEREHTENNVRNLLARDELAALGKKKRYNRAFLQYIVKLSSYCHRFQEPLRTGCIAEIVMSGPFDSFCSGVIILNTFLVAYSTNWNIQNVGSTTPSWIEILEWTFVGFYCIELFLKLLAHRMYFFFNSEMRWNIFDFVLVLISLIDLLLSLLIVDKDGGQQNMVIMRVFRMIKLAKILRTLRALRLFKDLVVILDSFRSSAVAFLWAMVMVAFVIFVFSLIFLQGLTDFMAHGDPGSEQRAEVDKLFGTLPLSMLSLYQASTGGQDWAVCYDVVKLAGELYAFTFVTYTFFFYFAVLNILTGIFVEKAMCAALPDRDDLVLQRRQQLVNDVKEFKYICKKILDPGNTNTVTWEDFEKQMHNEIMVAYLASIGLEIHEVKMFFHMIAGSKKTDSVTIDRFVEGCMHMKGMASGIDMQSALYQLEMLRDDVKKTRASHRVDIQMLNDALSRERRRSQSEVANKLITL